MIYTASVKTEKLGDANDKRVVMLPVAKGLVYRVEIEFPPGCSGLLSVKIFDGGYQVWPSNRDGAFRSDGCTIAFDDSYLKQAAPFEFRIETENIDNSWSHTINVRLGMASNEAFMSRYMPSISWEKFQVVLAKASLEQEVLKKAAILQLTNELREV